MPSIMKEDVQKHDPKVQKVREKVAFLLFCCDGDMENAMKNHVN